MTVVLQIGHSGIGHYDDNNIQQLIAYSIPGKN